MEDTDLDEQVLALRVQGRSFGAIATAVGLERPLLALEAFQRAVRRRPPTERETLRADELHRLDTMARHLRTRRDLDASTLERRLEVVDRLRGLVTAD